VNVGLAHADTPTRIFVALWAIALLLGTATLGWSMFGIAVAFVAVFGLLCALTTLWTKPLRRSVDAIGNRAFAIAVVIISIVFAVVTYDGMLFWGIASQPIPLWSVLRHTVGNFAVRLGVQRTELQNPLDSVVLPFVLLAPLRLGRTAFGVGPFRAGAGRVALLWIGLGIAVPVIELVLHAWAPMPLGRRVLIDLVRNGYSEEFLCRGVILGVLSARLGTSAANVVQALAFGALHAGTGIYDYHNVLVAMSHTMLTNAVFGLAMGFLTVRTGNIAIPGAFHALLDAWVPG